MPIKIHGMEISGNVFPTIGLLPVSLPPSYLRCLKCLRNFWRGVPPSVACYLLFEISRFFSCAVRMRLSLLRRRVLFCCACTGRARKSSVAASLPSFVTRSNCLLIVCVLPPGLLTEAGIENEVVECNIMEGAHKTPEFLKMNPMHCIPTMVSLSSLSPLSLSLSFSLSILMSPPPFPLALCVWVFGCVCVSSPPRAPPSP